MLRRHGRLRNEFILKLQKQKSKYVRSDCSPIVADNVLNPLLSNLVTTPDDEYRLTGITEPKIVITTSRDPSSKLKMFVKELRLIFPNSQRINRGKYELKLLADACLANKVTDLIFVHEHRGIPDNLIIYHLPYGPTAYFNIANVVMRHDVPDTKSLSEQKPHLIFHNFETDLGLRTARILRNLFPVPKINSTRTITFANHDDYIFFRHHLYTYDNNELIIQEVGPRFTLKLYEIKLGTIEDNDICKSEWVLRPFMNTSAKKRFLSQKDGWKED